MRQVKTLSNLFINGKFVPAVKGGSFNVINPATEQTIASVQQATKEDVDLAISSAKKAFGGWSSMNPYDRAGCLYRLADLIQKNADELAYLQSLNNGKPYSVAKVADLPLTHRCYKYYAGLVQKIKGSTFPINGPFQGYTFREPVGVVGQIIPWNFPLLMQAWKLGPALAAGCTVVMKTAEQTPLTALRVAEYIKEAGFPDGVVNVLSGYGDAGQYLAQHKDVNKVAFTGSTEVGYSIMRGSHKQNLKRVTLQLGGKSPNIITANANLEVAVSQSCMGLFFNAGQCCIAGSRTYVHSSVYDNFVKMAAEKVSKIKLGCPQSIDTDQGPLVSKDQFQRVMKFIQTGKNEGAKLEVGGGRHGTKGFFVQPTLFSGVTDKMSIFWDQIFGPVMAVIKYDDIEKVIESANNNNYGLGAGVVSEDINQVNYLVRRLQAGTVYVNCYNVFDSTTPFGGYKDSGVGRELGEQALSNYLQTKTVIVKQNPVK